MFSGNTSGVLFLVSRDYPNCFTVRLRLPPSKQLDEVALQVAKRSNFPKQLHIVSAHVRSKTFTVEMQLFHIPKGRYDVCWDLIKSKTGVCPRGPSCRWEHLQPVFITVNLEHHDEAAAPAAEQPSSPRPNVDGKTDASTPDTSASTVDPSRE